MVSVFMRAELCNRSGVPSAQEPVTKSRGFAAGATGGAIKARDRSVDSGGNACAFHWLLLLTPHQKFGQNAKLDVAGSLGSDISAVFFLEPQAGPVCYQLLQGRFWAVRARNLPRLLLGLGVRAR